MVATDVVSVEIDAHAVVVVVVLVDSSSVVDSVSAVATVVKDAQLPVVVVELLLFHKVLESDLKQDLCLM